MKTCKHASCGEVCKYPKKEKKPYQIKRKPLKKKAYKINRVSKSREIENDLYFRQRDQFLNDHPLCQLKTPVCTKTATCIHHTRSRGEYFLDKTTWMASCHQCNTWVERNDAEARNLGLKKSKFQMKSVLHIRIDSAGYNSDAIESAWKKAGFKYQGFFWQQARFDKGTEKLRKSVIEVAKDLKPHYIFAHIQSSEVFDLDTWKELQRYGFVINYTFDVRSEEKIRWMYDVAKHIGFTFFASENDVARCQGMGIKNVGHVHSSCDMDVFKPGGKNLFAFDAVFVGNNYVGSNLDFPLAEERQEMIGHLQATIGTGFMVYGHGQRGGRIEPEVEANVYNFSRVAISHSNFQLDGYTSDRLWRIMASGCLCLAKWFPGIEQLFKKGVHLDWWSTFEELESLIKKYTSDKDLRDKVAKQGCDLVRENHTWFHRINEMLTKASQ